MTEFQRGIMFGVGACFMGLGLGTLLAVLLP